MKKISLCFDNTAVLPSSVKTSGRFFQIFVPFSEKLDFTLFVAVVNSVEVAKTGVITNLCLKLVIMLHLVTALHSDAF